MKKLALLLAFLPGLLCAADQKFTFALPDLDGRISLGVFTEHNKLVRTLFVGATTADFTVGLNGLITTWDGKNEAGVAVPPGKYHVRGYVVGDAVKAEGEAYHFNDWIEDEKSPRITSVEDFQKIERGFVLLFRGPDSSRSLARYDLEKGFLWTKPADASPGAIPKGSTPGQDNANRLALAKGGFVVLSQSALEILNPDTGQQVAYRPFWDFGGTALAASGSSVRVVARDRLRLFTLPSLESAGEAKLPAFFAALAINGAQSIGGSPAQPDLWISQGADWKNMPTGLGVVSLCFGLKDTYWLAGAEEKGGASLVGQFNAAGELLRAYRGDFTPEQVRASSDTEEISVLEKKDATQRLRQMSLSERPGGGSEWEINFEKAITPCTHFGVVDGRLVADAGEKSQRTTMEFPLNTGGLTTTPPKLTVQLACDSTGLWLVTASHLKLARLADQVHADRFVLVPGEKEASMTAYAGDGVVVAEYLVSGLDNIAEIDAGEIEIP